MYRIKRMEEKLESWETCVQIPVLQTLTLSGSWTQSLCLRDLSFLLSNVACLVKTSEAFSHCICWSIIIHISYLNPAVRNQECLSCLSFLNPLTQTMALRMSVPGAHWVPVESASEWKTHNWGTRQGYSIYSCHGAHICSGLTPFSLSTVPLWPLDFFKAASR